MKPRHRIYIIVVSILLHILLLLLWEGAIRWNWIDLGAVPPPVDEEPIVFDLQQPQQPREVIETPDDANVTDNQKDAKYLSDKSALARNPESDPNVPEGEAFSRGYIDSHDLPARQGMEGVTPQPPAPDSKEKGDDDSENRQDAEPEEEQMETDAEIIYEEYRKRKEQSDPAVPLRRPGVTHNQVESKALDQGGLSFNTYDWDFAPYMLALKHRIRRNIFPPAAFTHLGMIDGDTLVRFRIYPNGELRALNLLGYNGHESLMQTSMNAVNASAPFPELPSNFPEPYLEVTGKFVYFVHRGSQSRRTNDEKE